MKTLAAPGRPALAAAMALAFSLSAFLPLGAQASSTKESAIDSGVSFAIDSNPRGALVEINGARVGVTPLTVSGYGSGDYDIVISLEGHYDGKFRVNAVDKTKYAFFADLVPRRGILRIEAVPLGTEILIDENRASSGEHRLSVGRHKVTARLFGYQTQEQSVAVNDMFPESISFSLKKAEFSVSGASVSRPRFNPSAPGSLGSTVFSFTVSAPGSGSLRIESGSGLVVARKDFEFDDWGQSFRWNGRDLEGGLAAEGEYSIVLEARGDDGVETSSTNAVKIDATARIEPRGFSLGLPGYALCPAAAILPKGDGEMGAGASFPLAEDYASVAFPFWSGFRLSLSDFIETYLAINSAAGPGAGSGIAVSGGLKWQFLKRGSSGGFDGSAYAGGLAAMPGPLAAVDVAANGSALKFGLPFTLSLGFFDISLSPEFSLGFPTAGQALPLASLSAAFGLQAPFGDVHLSANARYRIGAASLDGPLLTAIDARILPSWAPVSFGIGFGLGIGSGGEIRPSLSASLSLLI
jgi:hypothetical protein